MSKETQITTGKVRFSYVHVFEKYVPKNNPGQKAKYSLSVIIRKSDKKTIDAIKAAIEAAKQDTSKWGGKLPKNLKTPLRDGDAESDDPAYAGCYYINCTSERKPGVVDADLQPIFDAEELYSGCYGRVQINFYAFSVTGNNGIAAGLQNVQKLEDGEALGGSVPSPQAAFGSFEDDDDDCLN